MSIAVALAWPVFVKILFKQNLAQDERAWGIYVVAQIVGFEYLAYYIAKRFGMQATSTWSLGAFLVTFGGSTLSIVSGKLLGEKVGFEMGFLVFGTFLLLSVVASFVPSLIIRRLRSKQNK